MSLTVEEAFRMFDTEYSQKIPANSLGPALRSLGKRLTEEQVAAMKATANEAGGLVTLEQFKGFVATASDIQKTELEIEQAFRIFEKDSEMKAHGQPGTADKRSLRHAICSLGDTLSKEEAEHFLEYCAPGQQSVSLESLLKTVRAAECH